MIMCGYVGRFQEGGRGLGRVGLDCKKKNREKKSQRAADGIKGLFLPWKF